MHAHDPVDWRAYDERVFEVARASGRPVFLSLGYTTCHWCRVMEEESYQDPEVAAALNRGFVPVKVDREGQPQVAEAYARAAAAMGERVGWPLHVFLLPDGTPFHAATYLPREGRPGRPGILTVLASVREAFDASPDPLARRGEALREEVRRELVSNAKPAVDAPDRALLEATVEAHRAEVDPAWGGRRRLPKRPTDPPVALLLRHHRRSGDTASLEAALLGLEHMAEAPVRDGDGGFHEAVLDRRWQRPRPEKRLADNARVALAYLDAWQVTGRPELASLAGGPSASWRRGSGTRRAGSRRR